MESEGKGQCLGQRPQGVCSSRVRVAGSQTCCDPEWEAAYRQFETPAEETRKFLKRLEDLGAPEWSKEARVVELFCGRGNGLVALERLGFSRIEGVDLSETLLAEYSGPATCYMADCRELPFENASKDALIVQGGLHHLSELPEDLDRVLREARRVLTANGLLAVVEPWMTPFLALVHFVCQSKPARRVWSKIDALARMIDGEKQTYEQWLRQPEAILQLLHHHFTPVRSRTGWGKLRFVGRKEGHG